jgi:hypothetical protein
MSFYDDQDRWFDIIELGELMDSRAEAEVHTDADLGWPEGAVDAVEKSSFPEGLTEEAERQLDAYCKALQEVYYADL